MSFQEFFFKYIVSHFNQFSTESNWIFGLGTFGRGTFGRNFLENENNCSYKNLIRFFFFQMYRGQMYFSRFKQPRFHQPYANIVFEFS
jgi:hypothetical protein